MVCNRYAGFNFTNERYADNTGFYRECLSHQREASQIGVTAELAQRELDFLGRFPPDKEHHRLSAHKVDVYAIRNPVWHRNGKLVKPHGDLEKVFSVDFGVEIKKICEEESGMREELGVKTIRLEDGTEVTGMHTRVSRYAGSPNRKTIPNNHLKIQFDPSRYREQGEFTYAFEIDRSSITIQQPKEFHIRSYVLVDGQNVWEEKQVARAAFLPSPYGDTPVKFHHLTFTEK